MAQPFRTATEQECALYRRFDPFAAPSSRIRSCVFPSSSWPRRALARATAQRPWRRSSGPRRHARRSYNRNRQSKVLPKRKARRSLILLPQIGPAMPFAPTFPHPRRTAPALAIGARCSAELSDSVNPRGRGPATAATGSDARSNWQVIWQKRVKQALRSHDNRNSQAAQRRAPSTTHRPSKDGRLSTPYRVVPLPRFARATRGRRGVGGFPPSRVGAGGGGPCDPRT